MSSSSLAIGVFDSGMGGLTVLRALKSNFPYESFIYLGDTARLPYGTKSPATVLQYAIQMARILVERQIKALVIACNTATTAALPHLQAILPHMPVLGVITPSAAAAATATNNQQIAILATETTIASNVYQQMIYNQLPHAKIYTRACSLLVALAEEGMVNNTIAHETLLHYLQGFGEEDTLLLGCTHFPVFKPLLEKLLPPHVTIIDSAQATANALHSMLTAAHLLQSEEKSPRTIRYLVTDSIHRFQTIGEIFLGEPLICKDVELVDAVQRTE